MLEIKVTEQAEELLADFISVVERLENAVKRLKVTGLDASIDDEAVSDDSDDKDPEDDDEDFAPKKAKGKKAKAFDEESEEDAEETPEATDDESFEEEEEVKPKKKAKAKKITVDDVNDACKKRASVKGGAAGRTEVLTILKKKFKTSSISDLSEDTYAAVIAAMKA
jgi:hypothetical protein